MNRSGQLTESQTSPLLTRRRESKNLWFKKCTEKMQSIASLSEDWDSYGARRPNHVSLHYAYAFLEFISTSVNVAAPTVTPAPSGNICFEWEDDRRLLATEIDDSGVHHYYYESYIDDVEEEGESLGSQKILELITKL